MLEAAKLNGYHEVPVLRVESLSESEKRALRLALNRVTEDGVWDRKLLASEFRLLVEEKFDIELTAFEAVEVDMVLEEHPLRDLDKHNEEDSVPCPQLQDPPVSTAGDLWLLGKHRLVVGDARDPLAYACLLGEERATVGFTDPPYNVAMKAIGGRGKTKHPEFAMAAGEMTRDEYRAFLQTAFSLMADHSSNGAVHFICTDGKHLSEMSGATEAVYGAHLALVVWDKVNAGMGGLYRNQHELIFVEKVGKGPSIDNVQLGKFGRNRSTVWQYRGLTGFGKGRRETLAMHPTVKPTALVRDAMLDVTRRNDIVLDPFAGSGTTVIAAEQIGRRARVIEIDRHYADVIVRRWQKYAGANAVHAATGLTFDETSEQRRLAVQATPVHSGA